MVSPFGAGRVHSGRVKRATIRHDFRWMGTTNRLWAISHIITTGLLPFALFEGSESQFRWLVFRCDSLKLCIYSRSVKPKNIMAIAFWVASNVTAYSSSQPPHLNDKKPALSRSASMIKANSSLSFETNVGQFNSEARYISRGDGYDLFLTPAEAVFNFKTQQPATASACGFTVSQYTSFLKTPRKNSPLCYTTSLESVRLRLTGANPEARPEGRSPLSSYSNYLLGNDPRKWYKHVPHFGEVWYAGVYPGIDLVYYGTNGQLEYDFVVAPDANANQIAFSITGLDGQKLRANANGDLVIPAGDNEVLLCRPRIYQGNSCLHAGPGAIDSESSSCREIAGGRFRFDR